MKGAPLPALVLARTGQDVRQCQACDQCQDLLANGMDLAFGEILRLAAIDDERCLRCASLWCCEPLLKSLTPCPAGIDIPAAIRALRQEALQRGFYPLTAAPEWIL